MDSNEAREKVERFLNSDYDPHEASKRSARWRNLCWVLVVLAWTFVIAFGIAKIVHGQQVKGETAMIVFKAKWCQFCKEAAPHLVRLRAEGFDIRVIDIEEPVPGMPNVQGGQLSQEYWKATKGQETGPVLPSFYIVGSPLKPGLLRYDGEFDEADLRQLLTGLGARPKLPPVPPAPKEPEPPKPSDPK